MSDYPALARFFGAYFHQDWHLYSADMWGVVQLSLAESSAEDTAALVVDIDRVRARQLTDAAVKALVVDEFECGYWAEADGWTWRGWLSEVARLAGAVLRDPVPEHATLMSLLSVYFSVQSRAWFGSDPLAIYLNRTGTPTLETLRAQVDDVLGQSASEHALTSLTQIDLSNHYDSSVAVVNDRDVLTEIRRRVRDELDRRRALSPLPDAIAQSERLPGATHPAAEWLSDATASTTVAAALASNRVEIRGWLTKSGRRTLALTHAEEAPVGKCAPPEGATKDEVNEAFVALRRFSTVSQRRLEHALLIAYPILPTQSGDTRYPELRQLFAGYFNPDWDLIYGPDPWAALTRYLAESAAPEIDRAATQLEELLARDLSERELSSLLVAELWCAYDAAAHGWTYRGWLNQVGRRARAVLDDAKPEFFELGQLVGGYFGDDWATRLGPDDSQVLSTYLRGASVQTIEALTDQLGRVLAQDLGEADLRSLLWDELGCRYLGVADGRPDLTYRYWLSLILRVIT